MLSIFTRRIVLKQVKCIRIDLFKKSLQGSTNRYIRLDNYSNVTLLNKLNSPKLLVNHMNMCTNNLSVQEKIIFTNQLTDPEKFHDLLEVVKENQNNLSVEFITSFIPEMLSILNDSLLEDHHKEELTKSESFVRLLNAVEELVFDMSAKDLVSFLLLCKRLNVPFKIEPYRKALEKLYNSHNELSFYELCTLWNILPQYMNLSRSLRNIFKMKIINEIRVESHLDSPDDTIGALIFLSNKNISPRSWEKSDILKKILEFEELNDAAIFKNYLRLLGSTAQHHKYFKITKDSYFKRVVEEVTDNNFLASFLASYGEACSNRRVDYDGKLVDDIVNKMMGNELKAKHVKILCQTLAQLKHSHYEFVKYLIDFIKRNPNVFTCYPGFSSRIIPVIANTNYGIKERNRWKTSLPDLSNSPGLVNVAKSLRNKLDRYLYFLIELASLDIFIDEEIMYVAKLVSASQNLTEYYPKLLKFFLILDQAVKILRPDFSRTVLSNFNAALILEELKTQETESRNHKQHLLSQIEMSLEAATGVKNCLLMQCLSKSNVELNGIVGINEEGQLLDFSTVKSDDTKVFIEDIASLTDYNLLAITIISEKEVSRNTMDFNAAWALGLKIQEKIGYPALFVHETTWTHLTGDKGNFMLNKIVQEAQKFKKSA